MSHTIEEIARGSDAPPPEYKDIFTPFTEEEMKLLPIVKRFFECVDGDKELRDNLKAGTVTPQQRALLKEIGITFEVEDVAPIYERHELFEKAMMAPESPEAAEVLQMVQDNPILHLWGRYRVRRAEAYIEQRRWLTSTPGASLEYHAWRMRRIAATKSELGTYGYEIDHPALAIEMQVGCSVGCYFCAFDAKKLEKVFDINAPGNRELFRGVATSFVNRLGWNAGHALLYWSTEPADNPHYIEYMKEYREVTGSQVCTATARADEKWVGDLMEHYGYSPWPRISVLTRSIMYKLHRRFTPEQARHMVLLMQQKDGEEFRAKVPGGRDKMVARLESYTDLRSLDTDRKPEDVEVPQGSIACVSGFLVNLLEKTIRLISPCYTTEQYRYGYRTFDTATFTDAADFDRQLAAMIARKMVLEPYPSMPMRFRDDLRYRPDADGFRLSTRNQVHKCEGYDVYAPLGELISQGTLTYQEVVDSLVDRGYNAMIVAAVIKGLFDEGFLCELAVVNPEVATSAPELQLTH